MRFRVKKIKVEEEKKVSFYPAKRYQSIKVDKLFRLGNLSYQRRVCSVHWNIKQRLQYAE